MSSYNKCNIIITNNDGESFQFEMENFSITDPITTTSRNGQKIKEGLNDPVELTGEAIYSFTLHQFLKSLSKVNKFFTLTFQTQAPDIFRDKQVYANCLIQSSDFLESADKGAEYMLNIAFSLNNLVDDVLISEV